LGTVCRRLGIETGYQETKKTGKEETIKTGKEETHLKRLSAPKIGNLL
jgi:hypothetical protein